MYWLKFKLFLLIATSCQEDDECIMTSGKADQTDPDGSNGEGVSNGDEDSDNDADPSGENEVSVDVIFANGVGPEIQDACFGCHRDQGVAIFLPLDSQQALQDKIGADTDPATNTFLENLVNDANPMPPNAEQEGRDDLLELLQAWADSGFLYL